MKIADHEHKNMGVQSEQNGADAEGSHTASRLRNVEKSLQQLWELRESDAASIGELAARLERLEAAFGSGWSMIRRFEVDLHDVGKTTDHYAIALDALVSRLQRLEATFPEEAGSH